MKNKVECWIHDDSLNFGGDDDYDVLLIVLLHHNFFLYKTKVRIADT
jgi:hypothetical protein